MTKLFLLALFVTFTSVAQDNMFEIECDSPFPYQNYDFEITIDQTATPSSWRRGHITVFENGQLIRDENYNLSWNSQFGNKIQLWGEGMSLEIDLWPDSVPRFGQYYRSTYRNRSMLNNQPFNNIECRFPWAN
ncbi:MAG: hypothetical protein ACOYL6_11365 [Bacteriovoracaceae bacterium]